MSFNSSAYWEKRYATGGNSGDGSYNHLAEFKAAVINQFIHTYNIKSIVDYGVGDGNQCALIDTKKVEYYGIDVSDTAISMCQKKRLPNKIFMTVNEFASKKIQCQVSISCDVIYHLIEDIVYKNYMQNLCNFSDQYIIIYAKNENIYHTQHVKFRKFSDYLDMTNYKLLQHIPNPYPQNIIGRDNTNTSPSDFYVYKKKDVKDE